jgi:hypothetical protein
MQRYEHNMVECAIPFLGERISNIEPIDPMHLQFADGIYVTCYVHPSAIIVTGVTVLVSLTNQWYAKPTFY